jgi:alginate O-acetyltransferase complex protein AlgI
MVFSSPVFLFLFLPIILGLYLVLPRPARNPLLLTASLFFYLWGEKLYVLVLIGSIGANYVAGLWLDRVRGRSSARLVIALAIAANLGLLAAFKYANFLVSNLNVVLDRLHWPAVELEPIHLPLGISFFTFHALSYLIDVYRQEVPALKSPLNFALYISFFPQSIAGPIVRYADIASQLRRRLHTVEGFATGVRRFVVGLAKKMVVANTLAAPADAIFNLPAEELTASLAWLGVVCYTLQIYFDFSGYSDMAIGLARFFGFRFRENFHYPYIAGSVTEFWRRWHISLSTWYRDYVYIPLGGNRLGRVRLYFNLVTVFFLCGLWHGASWTFVIWGLFHGAFLVLERTVIGRWLERTWAPVRHLYTLLVVMVGWVLFKAATLPKAMSFLSAMTGFGVGAGARYHPGVYLNNLVTGVLVIGIIGCLPVVPVLARVGERLTASGRGKLALFWETIFTFAPVLAHAFLLLVSSMLLAGGTYNPFIYFRF